MVESNKPKTSGLHVSISKKMSFLLRHGAEKEGVEIDSAGWIKMNDILNFLNKGKQKIHVSLIKEIIENNDK